MRAVNARSPDIASASLLASRAATPPAPRVLNGVNWEGLKTLYLKEVRRFFKVGLQTVGAPVVTTLLYMLIFVVAVGKTRPEVEGVSFGAFVGPGLIMMAILNNSFANASSSIIQAKIMGTAPDFLTPPLSPFELAAGFGLGAMTRGVLVGFVTALAVWPFSRYGIAHLGAVIYFAAVASLIMAMTGVLAGLWSEKFDHLATVTNFVIMPLSFLSGTFYSISALPTVVQPVARFNPFFYLIDGFRFGFTGHSDASIALGVAVSLVLAVGLSGLVWELFRRGWRLKS